MRAVVVAGRGHAPTVAEVPTPVAGPGEQIVQILASGVHPIVKATAAGTHYASPTQFPFVPGVDAIARLSDGSRAYVGFARAPYGTLSTSTVIPAGWSIPIPDDSVVSDAVLAGSMNPLVAVWMALVQQAQLQPGERVLILGATGTSGRLAVRLAGELGASRVVAAGRNQVVLDDLGRTHGARTVTLTGEVHDMAQSLREAIDDGVDVVLDYLWGPVARAAIEALARSGLHHHARPVRFVNVGEMSGATIDLPAAVLRSSGLRLLGSGAGSVDPAVIAAAMPDLISRVSSGALAVDVCQVPLEDAARAWSSDTGGARLVIVP